MMEPPIRKPLNIVSKNIKAIIFLATITLILLILIRQKYPLLNISAKTINNPTIFVNTNATSYNAEAIELTDNQETCDIFTGEWIPNPDAPYYTNTTCWAIHEHQNCMKFGRPDNGFMKWRWKPDGCDLQVFNPYQFLDLLRNQSLAFVGDSVGRNQMQSLICLLTRVEYPIDVSPANETDQHFKRLKYINYNFTLVYFWTPFLVRSNERDSMGSTGSNPLKIYLDELDVSWMTRIDEFDYVILNVGHWMDRPALYYENQSIVGCRYCQLSNVTDLPLTYSYRRIFQTIFNALNDLENFKGVTFLRSFAPSHFENGPWNAGGDCVRQRPFKTNETILEGLNMDMYTIQLEEFRARRAKEKKRFKLLDTTRAMLLRPDGHPSRYGHLPNASVALYNDCVHWCLPGPIDSWADLLLHMVKLEVRRSYKEKLLQQPKKNL